MLLTYYDFTFTNERPNTLSTICMKISFNARSRQLSTKHKVADSKLALESIRSKNEGALQFVYSWASKGHHVMPTRVLRKEVDETN
jgi:hypothetical protein